MGIIAATRAQSLAIPGMSDIMPNLYFTRANDTGAPPYGVLIDMGRDPMIEDANFEDPQVLRFNFLFQFWTPTLEVCESWMTLMDTAFEWGQVSADGYTAMPEGVEVGRVQFEQEPKRSLLVSLMHRCDYPVKVPVTRDT